MLETKKHAMRVDSQKNTESKESEVKVEPELKMEEKIEKARFRVGAVDISSAIESQALDAAETALTEDKDQQKGLRGFFRKMWRHNLAREYYRQKELAKAKERILSEQNVYANEGEGKSAHDQAASAVVERFLAEFDETLHTEAGEKKKELANSPEEQLLKTELQNLVRYYAGGRMSDEVFEEEKLFLFAKIAQSNPDVINRGELYADNLLEIGQEVRKMVENGKALDELDIELDVTIGRAKLGARTETQFNAVDRLVDKFAHSRAGKWIGNEAVIAGVVGATYGALAMTGKRLVMSKAAALGTFGATTALAGLFAGLKERVRFENERRLHNRQMAVGMEFDDQEAKRRNELERFRYEMRSASSAITELRGFVKKMRIQVL